MPSAAGWPWRAFPLPTKPMLAFYDLHIHSSLSPCADEDMTPQNICGMARLKGLDVIAVTDHNAADSLPYMAVAAKGHGLLCVPGIEVTSREEVHLLGYFPSVQSALEAGAFFKSRLPKMKNRPDFFGAQTVYDLEDRPVHSEDALLIGATDQSILECFEVIRGLQGVCVPAHIDRGVNGLLSHLGFMPQEPVFGTLEIAGEVPQDDAAMKDKGFLRSSDAHQLGMISERRHTLSLPEMSIEAVLKALLNGLF